MLTRGKLRHLNVVLITTFVALCLACGGDPEDPPQGSIWEKLCGTWVSDPIPLADGKREDGSTKFEIDISYWNTGPWARCPNELAFSRQEGVALHEKRCSFRHFNVTETTATSDLNRSEDGSTWIFRVDAENSDVMYATWLLKNGTKRLEEVRFMKNKK